MIPDIGLMVAAYIITKMVSMANNENESIVVKILCAVTILVTAIALVDLLRSGSSIPAIPR